MDHVDQISRGRIVMGPDEYLPVGDSYRNSLAAWLRDHSVGAKGKPDCPRIHGPFVAIG